MAEDALRCPFCKTLCPTRDGTHYGTHFENAAAQKPCAMSSKSIQAAAPGAVIDVPGGVVIDVAHDLHSMSVLAVDALADLDPDLFKKKE